MCPPTEVMMSLSCCAVFRSVRQGDQSRMPAEPFRLEVTFRSSHTIDAVNKRQIRSLRQLQSCKSSVPALEEEMACRQQLRTSESCVVHVEFKGSKAELNSKVRLTARCVSLHGVCVCSVYTSCQKRISKGFQGGRTLYLGLCCAFMNVSLCLLRI